MDGPGSRQFRWLTLCALPRLRIDHHAFGDPIALAIRQRDLWLEGVYHKAFIEVNEEGTEAGAATGMPKVLAAPYEYQANHPFIFLIRDRETGAILFMGRVMNPKA